MDFPEIAASGPTRRSSRSIWSTALVLLATFSILATVAIGSLVDTAAAATKNSTAGSAIAKTAATKTPATTPAPAAVVRTSVGFINASGAAISTIALSPTGTSVVPVMIGNTGAKPSTPGTPALDIAVPTGFVLSSVDAGASPGITVPATWTCNGNSGVVRCIFPADSPGQPLALAPGKYITASLHLTADPAGIKATNASVTVRATLPGGDTASATAKATLNGSSSAYSTTAVPVRDASGDYRVELVPLAASSVMRGQSVLYLLKHTERVVSDSGITDMFTLPTGLTMDPVSTGGWMCTGGAVTAMCRHAGSFGPGGPTEPVLITIHALDNAPLEYTNIQITSTTDDGVLADSVIVPIDIVDGNDPALDLQRTTGPLASSPKITDGSRLKAEFNTDTPVYYALTNEGSAPIAAGATIQVQASISDVAAALVKTLGGAPSLITVTPMAAKTGIDALPNCTGDDTTKITCSIRLASAMAPHAAPVMFGFNVKVAVDLSIANIEKVAPKLAGKMVTGQLFGVTATLFDDPHRIEPATAILAIDQPRIVKTPATAQDTPVRAAMFDWMIPAGITKNLYYNGLEDAWLSNGIGDDNTPEAPLWVTATPYSGSLQLDWWGPLYMYGFASWDNYPCASNDLCPEVNNNQLWVTDYTASTTDSQTSAITSTNVVGAPSTFTTASTVAVNSVVSGVGESVTYTFTTTAPISNVAVRYAAAARADRQVSIDFGQSGGSASKVSFPSTGSASNYSTVTVAGGLAAGTHTIKIYFLSGSSTAGVATNFGSITANTTPMCTTSGGSMGAVNNGCTITGLTNGTSYVVSVTATNRIGTGPAATSTPTTPIGLPDAPTSVSGVSGAAQATVSWTAPSSTGGSAITSYTVTSSPGGYTCTTSTTSCVVTGLTNGTAYTFTVKASNGVGSSSSSASSGSVTPLAVPGAPTSVVGVSGAAQATVSWTAPTSNGGATITGYTVTSSPGSFTCTTATTSCAVTGLTNGTSYTFTVKATNSVGAGSASTASSAVVPGAVPGAPTSVSAVYGSTQATVSWTAPTELGGSSISGYTVTSSPGGLTCTTATTSCIVTDLTNGTSYTFTVKATNTTGTGASSSASGSVVPATVPGPPTGVAGVFGNAQVTVSWTAPVSNGGAAITDYTVTSSPGSLTCSTTTATTCTVTGLTNGTAYTFTVKATNKAGWSSAVSSAVTPATVPGAPTAVSGAFGNTQTVVSWTAPSSTGGSAITGYRVISSPFVGTVDSSTTYGISATNLGGSIQSDGFLKVDYWASQGQYASYTFTTTSSYASLGLLYAAGNGDATRKIEVDGVVWSANQLFAGTGCWDCWWTKTISPTLSAGSHTLKIWMDGTAGSSTYMDLRTLTVNNGYSCTTATTSCTVTGLTNGTSYTFTVTATSGAGTGSASSASGAVVPATVPGAPTSVVGTANANAQSVVSWTAPSSNGGSAITGYTVTSSPGSFTCTTATTSCTVSGLTNGTSYTFTVTATNAAGTGSSSTASTAIIPSTVPGAPTGVSGVFGNAQVVVSWTAPSSNGSTITGYTVTSSPGSFTCTTTTATTCTVTGLTNGTSYTFTVTATNARGTGSASSASSAVTPATVPGAPTNVSGVSGNTQVTVSWSVPSSNGGTVTGYTVTSSPGSLTCTTATTSCTVSGLTNGTS